MTQDTRHATDADGGVVSEAMLPALRSAVHECNNLLAAIKGFTQLAQRGRSLEQVQKDLATVDETIDRAARLTHALLWVLRSPAEDPVDVDLARLLGEVLQVCSASLVRRELEVSVEVSGPLPIRALREAATRSLVSLLMAADPGHVRVRALREGQSVQLRFEFEGCPVACPAEMPGGPRVRVEEEAVVLEFEASPEGEG